MGFLANYTKNLLKINLLTKITTFVVAISLLLNIFHNFFLYFQNNSNHSLSNYFYLIPAGNAFLIAICVFFCIRFILIWSKKSKHIIFSQLFWFCGWIAIFIYHYCSKKYFPNIYYPNLSVLEENFLWSSHNLVLIFYTYFFLSPLKQISVFVVSLANTFKKSWDRF